MNRIIKHVGMLKNTGKKCIIIFLSIPGKEDHSLIIEPETLPDSLHDQVMAILESSEGQAAVNFGEVLGRRPLFHKNISVLEELHYRRLMYAVPHEKIVLLPNSQSRIEMKEFIEALKNINKVEKNTVSSPEDNVMVGNVNNVNNTSNIDNSLIIGQEINESYTQDSFSPFKEIANPLHLSREQTNNEKYIQAMGQLELIKMMANDVLQKLNHLQLTNDRQILEAVNNFKKQLGEVLLTSLRNEEKIEDKTKTEIEDNLTEDTDSTKKSISAKKNKK